jgi:hypothetical protein
VCGGAGVGESSRAPGPFREPRREPLVEDVDRDVEQPPKLSDEAVGLDRLRSSLAAERDRHADDDQVRSFFAHDLCEPIETAAARHPLDDGERAGNGSGRVRHGHARPGAAVVQRQDLHRAAILPAALVRRPPRNAGMWISTLRAPGYRSTFEPTIKETGGLAVRTFVLLLIICVAVGVSGVSAAVGTRAQQVHPCARAQYPGSTTDLWNGSTATSPSGIRPGSVAGDIFGTATGTPEPGHGLFRDDQNDGFVHSLEWQTATAVSIQHIELIAFHDGPSNLQRSFREFRLYFWNGTAFQLLHTFNPPLPYGGADPFNPAENGRWLYYCANVPATTADRWRAEFVQNTSTLFDGPRVVELDGFGEPLAVTFASFSAARTASGVRLRWRTASEVETLGFNVFRRVRGTRVKVNRRIIPSRASVGGAVYSFLDRRAPRNARGLRYWLQVIDLDGTRTWKGPIRVGRAGSS